MKLLVFFFLLFVLTLWQWAFTAPKCSGNLFKRFKPGGDRSHGYFFKQCKVSKRERKNHFKSDFSSPFSYSGHWEVRILLSWRNSWTGRHCRNGLFPKMATMRDESRWLNLMKKMHLEVGSQNLSLLASPIFFISLVSF